MRIAKGTWRTMVLMLAALWCAAASPTLHAQDTVPAVSPAAQDLHEQQAILNEEKDGASDAQREEAARKLVSRQTPEARNILKSVLESSGNPKGQLAVARALGGDPTPDPRFIAPLFSLMGPTNRLATEAAAAALVNYKGNRQVLDELIFIISPPTDPEQAIRHPRQKDTVRAVVARSAGTLVDKRIAGALTKVLIGADESQLVRDAAADGLLRMTGLSDNGRDAMRWQQWWTTNAAKNDDKFRLDLLDRLTLRETMLEQRLRQLTDGVNRILSEQYQAAADKPGTLLRYMGSSQPEIRATGVRIIQEEFGNGRGVSPAARQLRTMVGDSSPEVRLAVAGALEALNLPDALPSLLAQLPQEPDPDVRSQIVKALAVSNALPAAEQVVRMLDDKATVVVDTAVQAMAQLKVKLAEVKPVLARDASTRLRTMLEQRGSAAGNQKLREDLVAALASLNDPDSLPVYRAIMRNPRESLRTRVNTLGALASLADPKAADLVREAVEDEKESVREAALRALEPVAGREDTELLWRRIDPRIELDPSVQEGAWRVLSSLLPAAPEEWLKNQARRLDERQFQNDGGRRKMLLVLQALDEVYLKSKQDGPRAANWQAIGDIETQLKEWEQAARYYRMAFAYLSQQPNPREFVSERLINDALDAYLKGKKYADGVLFAGEVIALDPRHQETTGRLILDQADRLKDDGNLDDARLLLLEAAKLKLEKRFGEKIVQLAAEVDRMIQAKNGRTPASSGPRSSLSLLWPERG